MCFFEEGDVEKKIDREGNEETPRCQSRDSSIGVYISESWRWKRITDQSLSQVLKYGIRQSHALKFVLTAYHHGVSVSSSPSLRTEAPNHGAQPQAL
ncbi:hypothetical protein E3N88_17596 [Mikania micrantha]|uniref:Uncharacterized protein n=1 Tax=Mikania micrantha TaxID=192012 RepID=A0A5N6NTS7_9ASTR|nr:hypothetical protein E3N88_17596 [Mikania micrantha]